jgi:hypothetical protein
MGISLVRVNPQNPQILHFNWFLLKQGNNLIEKIFVSKIDFVVTEEFEIVALPLLLYRRKAIRKAVLVILLVKNKTTLECINDSIVS